MIRFVPATREMLDAHCPGKFSVNAFAAEEDGKVLAVWGVYLQVNCQVIFSWMSEEIKRNGRLIVKGWRLLKGLLERRSMPTLALCDLSVPKAELFLWHIGFRPYTGAIWKWEGK